MGVMQYAPLQTARRSRDRPLMYTKSNRKSGSVKSLAWFLRHFCFRFWLQGLPTFRRRPARVVPRAMLTVPFLGTPPVGVKPHDSDHAECEGVSNTTPSSKMFPGLYSCYLPPYIFDNISTCGIHTFLNFFLSLDHWPLPTYVEIGTFGESDFEGEEPKKI